jgi:hypothetical protein
VGVKRDLYIEDGEFRLDRNGFLDIRVQREEGNKHCLSKTAGEKVLRLAEAKNTLQRRIQHLRTTSSCSVGRVNRPLATGEQESYGDLWR